METKMLRWMAGVTRMDRIRNYVIRQKFGIAPIADKMRDTRLRCAARDAPPTSSTRPKNKGIMAMKHTCFLKKSCTEKEEHPG
ncbi:unnamed protein product [Heligmosomoides polygyrus]|uniref:HTH_Tnp_Tc3_1 domain-containing protein n=1 Tax=Heligmosomoides polygyrus TaxID=6339 RepID=A0A183F638_HELPZ|nr:unnamed protein product [Heligmosomoides polygyrus]